jgi:hypothetical protein
MLSCDNKPSIYLWLQINGDALGVNNLLFRIIHVSISSKTIQKKYSEKYMPNFCTLAVYLHLDNIYQGIYK